MKAIISLFALISSFIMSSAQISGDHLRFKDVPIDGSLSEYISAMKSVGFSCQAAEEDVAIMQGEFAGFKNCVVAVTASDDVVNMIYVFIRGKQNWPALYEKYRWMKGMLTEKYGEPAECIEEFQYPMKTIPDDIRIHLLRAGKCRYSTTYVLPEGTIELLIDRQRDDDECFIGIIYRDRINTDAMRAKVREDL